MPLSSKLRKVACGVLAAAAISQFMGVSTFGRAQGWEMTICAEPANLPFSNSAGEGFENRIAEIIASELGAGLAYVWIDPPLASVRDYLIEAGECDVLMGITDGHRGYLTTIVYYRSIFTFVYRRDGDLEVDSLDDPRLAEMRIGVQTGGGGGISPITQALATRGLIPNQVSYVTDLAATDPLLALPRAVADGEVDVAIVWGPVAGYAAREAADRITAKPVSPEIDFPLLPMYYSISVGVRAGDEALRDEINTALARRWDDIQAVLEEYSVPRLPLPAPRVPEAP